MQVLISKSRKLPSVQAISHSKPDSFQSCCNLILVYQRTKKTTLALASLPLILPHLYLYYTGCEWNSTWAKEGSPIFFMYNIQPANISALGIVADELGILFASFSNMSYYPECFNRGVYLWRFQVFGSTWRGLVLQTIYKIWIAERVKINVLMAYLSICFGIYLLMSALLPSLYNKIWVGGVFSPVWMTTYIVPILKSKMESTFTNNHLPISLTPAR